MKGPDPGQFTPLYVRLPFIYLSDDEELIIPGFPEVHPFDRSRIDDRGMFSIVQVLGFMDMGLAGAIEQKVTV